MASRVEQGLPEAIDRLPPSASQPFAFCSDFSPLQDPRAFSSKVGFNPFR